MEETRLGLILMMLREGSWWDAVKVYQEDAGVTFAVAKRRVRALAQAHGIRPQRPGHMTLAIIALASLIGLLACF